MMNEEQIFLANAYLDGELTDEERRLAEDDPAVMAEVDELRALQAEIRAVEPPSATGRDAAIAAAMAEFAAAPVPAAPAPPPVVPYRPRPAYGRILAIAAAVVGVGVLGVVIANFPTGDDDDRAEDATVADEPAAEESLAEEPAEEPADREFAEADAADGGADAAEIAEEPAVDEAAAEPEPASADEAADDGGAAAADDDVLVEPAEEPAAEEPADATDLTARPGATREQPIITPEELGAYGAGLLELIANDELPATPETSCEPVVLDRAFLLFDDVVTEVLISIDPQASVVFALDPDSCDAVLDGPLPD